jgi:hypothetical protein
MVGEKSIYGSSLMNRTSWVSEAATGNNRKINPAAAPW